MDSILSTDYYVHFQAQGYRHLRDYLNEEVHSKIFNLVDENTAQYCLEKFLEKSGIQGHTLLQVPAGESHKNLEQCSAIWQEMSEKMGDRKSLLINLGGGVITDMGGFVASTFKRGIRFINVPTTLLSMVDASVGGKTGVDLGPLKNQIGLFSNPEMVIVDMDFLGTVSEREIKSGLAEIIKYGFTFDRELWEEIKQFDQIDLEKIYPLVHKSVEIKNKVVLEDLHESGLRKSLNFGHTVGHAVESYFLQSSDKKDLTHGEAIALGMVSELYYSSQLLGLSPEYADELRGFCHAFYGKIEIEQEDFQAIEQLMIYDKKNVQGRVLFVLLSSLEQCSLDVQIDPALVQEGLRYYL